MRRLIIIVVACLAVVEAAQAVTSSTGPRLKVPRRVAKALHQAGFPARTQCGEIDDLGVPIRTVPGCWIVIEQRGYSVHVVPHSTGRSARAVYEQTYSRWAKKRRMAVVRNLVVYGFRVPARQWQTIRRLVIGATR
jgi:hypothetical protein